ncbi:MAG: Fic family protein [Holosporaceae bacterium]|jgi:Fic family protein|nr:Fic family protein [Holosporaceae bacterium]
MSVESAKWIWQNKDWPDFKYDHSKIEKLEDAYLYNAGVIGGLYEFLNLTSKKETICDLFSKEAFLTSKIEGETLDRDSVRSSIVKNIQKDATLDPYLKENKIASVIVEAAESFAAPLSHKTLCKWYETLVRGRKDLINLTGYREHKEAMQIVSGMDHKPKVHYEAPPSSVVPKEMESFVQWFNSSEKILTPIVRAGIAHLWFALIHPFEDCNGRIARILAEKALAQHLEYSPVISLSVAIQKNRKGYYDALEKSDENLDITEWLEYFAKAVADSQNYVINAVSFTIKKAKFYDRRKNLMNERQLKVVDTILKNGTFEFKGGLSAKNYISITKASRATATRDLRDMVSKGILIQSGELRHTRYYLNDDV